MGDGPCFRPDTNQRGCGSYSLRLTFNDGTVKQMNVMPFEGRGVTERHERFCVAIFPHSTTVIAKVIGPSVLHFALAIPLVRWTLIFGDIPFCRWSSKWQRKPRRPAPPALSRCLNRGGVALAVGRSFHHRAAIGGLRSLTR